MFTDDFRCNEVLALSPEALALPSDADRRFRRLVYDYRLELCKGPKEIIVPPEMSSFSDITTEKKPGQVDGSKGGDDTQSGRFKKAEPRWMLWSYLLESDRH